MAKTITELHYDFEPAVCDAREAYPMNWQVAKVGENDVASIDEHTAAGEGDKWYYDINYKDQSTYRIFNPVHVRFITTEP